MKADDVESECGEPFRDDSGGLFIGQLGISDEVRSIKPDRSLRPVAEDELSVRSGDYWTVFSRRGVKTGGKIQRTAGQDIPVVWKRFPFFPRFGDIRRTHDRTEFRSEFSAFAVTDLEIQFCIPDFVHALMRQKPDPHSIGCALPLASILNAEVEFAFQLDFSGPGREAELFHNAVENGFRFIFRRERMQFPVDFKLRSGILRDRKRGLKTEIPDQ